MTDKEIREKEKEYRDNAVNKTFNRVMELESEKLIWEAKQLQEERK
jgi:hypothetical protein